MKWQAGRWRVVNTFSVSTNLWYDEPVSMSHTAKCLVCPSPNVLLSSVLSVSASVYLEVLLEGFYLKVSTWRFLLDGVYLKVHWSKCSCNVIYWDFCLSQVNWEVAKNGWMWCDKNMLSCERFCLPFSVSHRWNFPKWRVNLLSKCLIYHGIENSTEAVSVAGQ